jgi:triacylglycerol lipase
MYFPRQFDIRLALELAGLIKSAYSQFEAFQNAASWTLPGQYSLGAELLYDVKSGSQSSVAKALFDHAVSRLRPTDKGDRPIPIGFLAHRGPRSYLIFRGTLTGTEWIRNLNTSLTPYTKKEYGSVHAGFLQTYASLREAITRALSGLDRRRKVVVAGHSLGAALATLLAPDIELIPRGTVEALYTFASPRVGDNGFVSAFNESFSNRSFRITNTSDIVTSIPFPAPVAGIVGGYFSHVDTPVDFTVQANDLDRNHQIDTYLDELERAENQAGFFGGRMRGFRSLRKERR